MFGIFVAKNKYQYDRWDEKLVREREREREVTTMSLSASSRMRALICTFPFQTLDFVTNIDIKERQERKIL